MPDQADTAHSPVMAVYLQQQRFDRLRNVRAIARTVTFLALAAFAVTTILIGRAEGPGSLLARILIGCGMLAWVVAFVQDYRVHSNRLNSRMIMMRVQAVQNEIDELERRGGPPGEGPRRQSGAS